MTVDSFQGSEADIVFLSLVRSNNKNKIGFLDDPQRLNVALTRAKYKLLLFGSYSTLENCKSKNLMKLVLNAKIRSVFHDFEKDVKLHLGDNILSSRFVQYY
jgi:senataxin